MDVNFMYRQYSNELKRKICFEICVSHKPTLKTATDYGVPIKTLEKWITAYNKDNHCFDEENDIFAFKTVDQREENDYDDYSNEELKNLIMKKDIEIARLKKNYLVEGGGTEKKVFVSLSKKNTK